MSVVHGKEGKVLIGANQVAELQGFSIDREVKIAEHDSAGDTSVKRKVGIKDSSGTINCLYDKTDTNGQGALSEGAEVTLLLYPEGNTSGKEELTVPAIIQKKGITQEKGSIELVAFSWLGNGDVVEGTVA